MSRLKTLPYGNQLQNVAPRPSININLIVGGSKAWALAKNRLQIGIPAMVLPSNDSPKNYSYPVSG